MKYTNKAEVMWDVERNENNIYEMVIAKLVKNIIPKKDASILGDVNVSETFKMLTEAETYEEFCEKYSEGANTNPYATFIISLVENINDINIFRFESLDEDRCLMEAHGSPHLVHHEVIPALDDELVSFELTKNLENKIADTIKDDLERTANKEKELEDLKNDLDDIKTDEGDEKEESDEEEEEAKLGEPELDEDEEPVEIPQDVQQDLTESYGAANQDVITYMIKKKAKLSKADIEHICITHLKMKDRPLITRLSILINAAFDGIVNNISDSFNGRPRDERYSTPAEAVEICDLALSRKLGQYTKPIYDFIYDEFEGSVQIYAVAFISTLLLWYTGLHILITFGFSIYIAFRDIKALIEGIRRCKQVIIESVRRIDEEIEELEATKANPAKLAALKETRAKLAKNSGIRDLELYTFTEAYAIEEDMNEKYSIDMALITESMINSLAEGNQLGEVEADVVEAAITMTASTIVLIEMMGLKTHKEMYNLLND